MLAFALIFLPLPAGLAARPLTAYRSIAVGSVWTVGRVSVYRVWALRHALGGSGGYGAPCRVWAPPFHPIHTDHSHPIHTASLSACIAHVAPTGWVEARCKGCGRMHWTARRQAHSTFLHQPRRSTEPARPRHGPPAPPFNTHAAPCQAAVGTWPCVCRLEDGGGRKEGAGLVLLRCALHAPAPLLTTQFDRARPSR